MSTVVFAMEWLPQYRVAFYRGLRQRLAADGVDVRLIHGDPPTSRQARRDGQTLPWADRVTNRVLRVGGRELTIQPVWRRWQDADLLVLQHEAGLALNYAALARARFGGPPVAFWGHGHNPNPQHRLGPVEWVKERTTPMADWIFAYTERSAQVFESLGVPNDRITVVQNATAGPPPSAPTGGSGAEKPSAQVVELLAGLDARQARVGWMVSALDGWKRTAFLLDVLDRIRATTDDFEFVVVGAGEDGILVTEAAQSRPWLHYPGPLFGVDKAAVGERVDVTVHPGLIGLHVIDSFSTATPIVTANVDYHSHEVSYLEADVNAVILDAEADVDEFAHAVGALLGDADRLRRLQDGCRRAAEVYTLGAMVERFAEGVHQALAAPDRARRRDR